MSASRKPARSSKLGAKLSRGAEGLADNRVVTTGARAGYAVNGLLNLLIAWLGLQVAIGGPGVEADPSGAMALVAGTSLGFILLLAIVVSFSLLAVWQVGECLQGPEKRDRLKAAAKALVYVVLAGSAVSILMGSRAQGKAQANDATATLMGMPFGPVLVAAVGIAVVAIGGYHVYKGWTERFRRDLVSTPRRSIVLAGKVGYIARGVALVAIGFGMLTAGLTHNAAMSRGLDGALHDMLSLPWGQIVVILVSAGFAAYGLYSFSRARLAKT